MKPITDNDLTLLYYGEHDDPALPARVAGSEELSKRFEALSRELERMDALNPPRRDDDYGEEVWRRIAPRLDEDHRTSGQRWLSWILPQRAPRFSLAGALAVAVVVTLAFFLGREGPRNDFDTPADAASQWATAAEALDSNQLLTTSISGHLEQVNITFTQFANTSGLSADMAEHATDMLVANRLYRRSAESRGDQKLAAFLGELEPLLIELAHEAYKNSPATRDRMQQEVKDRLLFRVRVMSNQLNESQIST